MSRRQKNGKLPVRLLVVEENPQSKGSLTLALRRSGHNVDCVPDEGSADLRLVTETYDLVILDDDRKLSEHSGLECVRKLRARHDQIPIIIVSTHQNRSNQARVLDAGADDYVIKPFDVAELDARIRAIARRAIGRSGGDITVGGLRLQLSKRTVSMHDKPLILPPREYAVLECLMLRHGRVVRKSQLIEHVGRSDKELTESAIEIYVHRLRRKIESAGVELQTVRGFGYVLRATDEQRP